MDLTGTMAHIKQPNGDAYIGWVTSHVGDQVVMQDYSAWYAEADAPYNSGEYDEVQITLVAESIIC